MPTLTFSPQSTLGAGAVRGAGSSYPPAFTAADLAPSSVTVQRSLQSGSHYVTCGLLRYDTSSIPDGATVESAYLELWVLYRSGVNSRKLVAEWYDAGSTWDSGDYTTTAAATAHAGTLLSAIPAGSLTNDAPSKIQLALTSLSSISLTGITGIRLHVDGTTPTGNNLVKYAAQNGGGASWNINVLLSGGFDFSNPSSAITYGAVYYAPRLVVTYAESGQTGGGQPTSGTTADPAGSGAQPLALRHLPRQAVEWELELCDWNGTKISHITSLGRNRQLQFRMNRPAMFTFEVPSDDARVSGTHTDGKPLLWAEPGWRVIKAYRHEVLEDGSATRVLRFAGYVWNVGDAGEPGSAWTQVTAFDPLQVLAARHTNEPGTAAVKFTDQIGATIVRQLVDTTNATRGRTGITTEGGVFEQTPTRTVSYDMKPLSEACFELASSFNGFDMYLEPVDREDGILGRLHCYARLGLTQPDAVFAWGLAPNNCRSIRRLGDGAIVVTHLYGLGANGIHSAAIDPAPGPLLLEGFENYSEVQNQALLDALIAEELGFRKVPRELVEITPASGRAPEPFVHFHLGDLVFVYCGPRLRGGFQGLMRIYGLTLSISEEGVETVTQIVTGPES